MPHTAYLLLGSNVGSRAEHLRKARAAVSRIGQLSSASNIYETAPWGNREQEPFLNQAVCLRTEKDAPALLEALKAAERDMGRTSPQGKWMPREIDLDILLFDDEVHRDKDLVIPHPFLHERRFTLIPLCDIAPDRLHPVLGKTIRQLLEDCNDTLQVKLFSGY